MAHLNFMQNSNKPAKNDIPDLDLPDLSGMDRFTPRISAANALRLNDEYAKKFLTDPHVMDEWRKRKKCEVEFIL